MARSPVFPNPRWRRTLAFSVGLAAGTWLPAQPALRRGLTRVLRAAPVAGTAGLRTGGWHATPRWAEALRAAPPPKPVRLEASREVLRSCETCLLAVQPEDARDDRWSWRVEEPAGGALRLEGPGRARYAAPLVDRPTTFHVRACAGAGPLRASRIALDVWPPSGLWLLETGAAPAWDGLPSVDLMPWSDLTGGLEPGAAPSGVAFLPGPCRWLVAARAAGPLHVAAAPKAEGGCVLVDTREDRIRWLDAAGALVQEAGAPGAGQGRHRDGTLAEARFRAPAGAALAEDGTLYLADAGNGALRRIRDGEVTTLRSLPGALHRAGWGDHEEGVLPKFGAPLTGGLALDAASGRLYVGAGHSIACVDLEGGDPGRFRTVLGDPRAPGFEAWRKEPPASLAGTPCLSSPRHLAWHRGRLYISDQGNHAVRVFDPATGVLRTLAGDPGQAESRSGPAGPAFPHLDPDRCAALAEPAGLAFDEAGTCRVATRDGLALLRGLGEP